jgi:hypothetical protein
LAMEASADQHQAIHLSEFGSYNAA